MTFPVCRVLSAQSLQPKILANLGNFGVWRAILPKILVVLLVLVWWAKGYGRQVLTGLHQIAHSLVQEVFMTPV